MRFGRLFLNCGLETDTAKRWHNHSQKDYEETYHRFQEDDARDYGPVKEKYPEGYYEDDIIVFKNHKNETIEAIQVETPDTIYLIKIGKYLSVGLENFEMEVDVDPQVKPGEIDETEEEEEEEYDQPETDEDDPEDEEEDTEDNEEDDDEEENEEEKAPAVKNTKKKK